MIPVQLDTGEDPITTVAMATPPQFGDLVQWSGVTYRVQRRVHLLESETEAAIRIVLARCEP